MFSPPQIPSSAAAAAGVPQRDDKGPPTHPLIMPIASFSLLSGFLSYNTSDAGSLALVYSACTGMLGIWGLWVVSVPSGTRVFTTDCNPDLWRHRKIIFAGPQLISRKTGADKHTSSFIFGNKSSASEQKKQWKREQQKKR
jgi:hypothetical protein